MPAPRIIKPFDVFKDGQPSLILRLERAAIKQLTFQRGKETLRVKIRDADSRRVKNKAVYIVLDVNRNGVREVLGRWITDNEGAKFWRSVMTEFKNNGVEDIRIAVVPSHRLPGMESLKAYLGLSRPPFPIPWVHLRPASFTWRATP